MEVSTASTARVFDPEAYAPSLLTNGEDAAVRQHLYGWEDGLDTLRARQKGAVGGPTDVSNPRVQALRPVLHDLLLNLGQEYTWVSGGGPGVMAWVQESAADNVLRIRRPRTGATRIPQEGPQTLDVRDPNSRERALQRAAFTVLVTVPATASGTNELFYRIVEASKYETPRPLIILQPEALSSTPTREERMTLDVARNGVPALITNNADDAARFVRGFYRNVKDLRVFEPSPGCSRVGAQVQIELRSAPSAADAQRLNECEIDGSPLFQPGTVHLMRRGTSLSVLTGELRPERRYADLVKAVDVCNDFGVARDAETPLKPQSTDLVNGIRSKLAPSQSPAAAEATRALAAVSRSNRPAPDGFGISLLG